MKGNVLLHVSGASLLALLVDMREWMCAQPLSWLCWLFSLALLSTQNVGDLGSIPGLGRSPGGGHGNPL